MKMWKQTKNSNCTVNQNWNAKLFSVTLAPGRPGSPTRPGSPRVPFGPDGPEIPRSPWAPFGKRNKDSFNN